MFYIGDSYLVVNQFQMGQRTVFDIHFWIGNDSSQDE